MIVGVQTQQTHMLSISYCTLFSSEEAGLGWAETSSLSQINTYCFQASGPHVSDPCQVFSLKLCVHVCKMFVSVNQHCRNNCTSCLALCGELTLDDGVDRRQERSDSATEA